MSRHSVPNVLNPDEEDFEEEEDWTYEFVTDSEDEGGAWSDDVSTNLMVDLQKKKEGEKPVEEKKLEEKKLDEIKERFKKMEDARKSPEKKAEEKKREEEKQQKRKVEEDKGKDRKEEEKRKKDEDRRKVEEKRKMEETKRKEDKQAEEAKKKEEKKAEDAKRKEEKKPPEPASKQKAKAKSPPKVPPKAEVKKKEEEVKKGLESPLVGRKREEAAASPVKAAPGKGKEGIDAAWRESASPRRSISPLKKEGPRPGRLSFGGKGDPSPAPPPKFALASAALPKKQEPAKKPEAAPKPVEKQPLAPPQKPAVAQTKPESPWMVRRREMEEAKKKGADAVPKAEDAVDRRSSSPLKISSFRNASPVKKEQSASAVPEAKKASIEVPRPTLSQMKTAPVVPPAKPESAWAARRRERESASPVKREVPPPGEQKQQSESAKSSPWMARKASKPYEPLAQEKPSDSYAKARDALKKSPAKAVPFRSASPKKEVPKPAVPSKPASPEKAGPNAKEAKEGAGTAASRERSASPLKIAAFRNASPVKTAAPEAKKAPVEVPKLVPPPQTKAMPAAPPAKPESPWAARRRERESVSPVKKEVPVPPKAAEKVPSVLKPPAKPVEKPAEVAAVKPTSPWAARKSSPVKLPEAVSKENPSDSYAKARDGLKKAPEKAVPFRSGSPKKEAPVKEVPKPAPTPPAKAVPKKVEEERKEVKKEPIRKAEEKKPFGEAEEKKVEPTKADVPVPKKEPPPAPVKEEVKVPRKESASPRRSISPVKKEGPRPGRLSFGGKDDPPPAPPPKFALASVVPPKRVESASPVKKGGGGEDEGKGGKTRRELSASPVKGVLKAPKEDRDRAPEERRSRLDEANRRRATVEQMKDKDGSKAMDNKMRGSSVVTIQESPAEEKAAMRDVPKKPMPRSHSLVGDSEQRKPLSRAKSMTPGGVDRHRSVSPLKSVQDRRKAFMNPEAPLLIIDNVPRGNLLAKFLKNPPKAPSPPPKKQFKWELPAVSKAAESTYWKPPPKPQPYKSSAPEYRDNPLITEPILFPEEKEKYEEEKKREEEGNKAESVGGEKGIKPVTGKPAVPAKAKAPEVGKKEVGKKPAIPAKSAAKKTEPVKKKETVPAKKSAAPAAKKDEKKKAEPPKKAKVKKGEVKKAAAKKEEEEREEKAEAEEEKMEELEDEEMDVEEAEEAAGDEEEEELDEEEAEVEGEEEELEGEEEEVEGEEVEGEGIEEEVEGEEEDKENVEDEEEEEDGEPKRKRRKKSRKRKKMKKEKKERAPRKWVAPPRPPPEAIEMPPEERHLWDIGREEIRHGNRPARMYAKKGRAESIEMPFVLPWEHIPALQSQTGMGAFGTQRDAKIQIDQGHIELVQGSLHSDTLLPLFEESERTIADQRGLISSFGAHRRNVEHVVDSHSYDSDDKLYLSEGIIPRHMLGSVQSHNLEPMWGNQRLQTTKVWLQDGSRVELKCAPDSNGIIGKQFQPANPDNRAGSNIIERRRNIIQRIQGVGELKPSRLSEGIVPKIFSTDDINTRSGAHFGDFRPTMAESVGGYRMSFDDEVLCKMVIPYQTAASRR